MTRLRTTKHELPTNGTGTVLLQVDRLGVDSDTQRTLRPMHARSLANDWDEDLLGILTVSRRKDGYYIIDGQHRWAALMMLGRGADAVECKVFDELDKANEAKRFGGLNHTKAVRYIDDFHVRLQYDPVAVDVDKIIRGVGLKVSDAFADGNVTAVKAAEDVYLGKPLRSAESTPWALSRALRTLHGAWGKNRDAYVGPLILGLGAFHARYGADVDIDTLTKKLAKFDGGPVQFYGRAKIRREMGPRSMWQAVALVTLDLYNRGRRSRTLPDWSRK